MAIQGIHGVESEQYVADCDCPICEMMADGMFGIRFTSIDGHHLELDDEFAFSMHENREAQQREGLCMDYLKAVAAGSQTLPKMPNEAKWRVTDSSRIRRTSWQQWNFSVAWRMRKTQKERHLAS